MSLSAKKPITVGICYLTIKNKFQFMTEHRSVGVSWDGHRENNWQALGQKVSLKINSLQNSNQEPIQISANTTQSEVHAVLIAQTDRYLAQLNWTPEQGREYLQQKYGKRSRLQLSDTEILEFIDYLQGKLAQNCQI
jgi:hypothetical protein